MVKTEAMDAIIWFISKEKYGVANLSLIVIDENAGESQIEKQIRKNVNKYTTITIIPVIYCNVWFSIACYLKEKIKFSLARYLPKLKIMYLRECYLSFHSFLIKLRFKVVFTELRNNLKQPNTA